MKGKTLPVFILSLISLLVFMVSCQDRASDNQSVEKTGNILSDFDILTKFHETNEIVFQEPEAIFHLRSGWIKKKKQFVWSQGLESSVVFYTYNTSSDKKMILSCVSSSDTSSHNIIISLNGETVSSIDLRDTLKKYSIILPRDILRIGQNLLTLSFSRKMSSSDPNPQSFSIGLKKIIFKGGHFKRKSYWDQNKNGHQLQYNGSSFLYTLENTVPVRIRAEYQAKRGASGTIKVQTANQEDQVHILPSQDQKIELEIPGSEGGHVKIEFIVSGDKKNGKVMWKKIEAIPQESLAAISKESGSEISVPGYDRQQKPDIIFYIIDALRSDHLSCYGYERNTSPNMDAFAKENTLFLNAFANSSWTRPSGATLLTGLRVKNHKTMMRDSRLSGKLVTLAEILKENGYYTVAVNSNGNVGKKFGFDQGFDDFFVLAENRNRESIHVRSHILNREIAKFLETFTTQENRPPLFLWIWSTDPHDPYTPHKSVSGYFDIEKYEPLDKKLVLLEEFNKKVRESRFKWPSQPELEYLVALYDQEVLFNDISFGKLINILTRFNLYDDAFIILTADHGEEFRDHGWYGHGKTLFNDQIKIPLIIKTDAIKKGIQEAQVQHTDIYPTICDILNIPLPNQVDGDSLLGSIDFNSRPLYSEEALDGYYLRSIILGQHKFIHNLPEGGYLNLGWRGVIPFEMYRIDIDPNEMNNIIDLSDPVCASLKQILFSEFSILTSRLGIEYQKTDIPPELEETLRALGYLK
jgi:arylsulfatase A-like enzyme